MKRQLFLIEVSFVACFRLAVLEHKYLSAIRLNLLGV